jgi:hypothetical protein
MSGHVETIAFKATFLPPQMLVEKKPSKVRPTHRVTPPVDLEALAAVGVYHTGKEGLV